MAIIDFWTGLFVNMLGLWLKQQQENHQRADVLWLKERGDMDKWDKVGYLACVGCVVLITLTFCVGFIKEVILQ